MNSKHAVVNISFLFDGIAAHFTICIHFVVCVLGRGCLRGSCKVVNVLCFLSPSVVCRSYALRLPSAQSQHIFSSKSLFYTSFVINFEIFAPKNEWAALVFARSTAWQLRTFAYKYLRTSNTHTNIPPSHIGRLRRAEKTRTVY